MNYIIVMKQWLFVYFYKVSAISTENIRFVQVICFNFQLYIFFCTCTYTLNVGESRDEQVILGQAFVVSALAKRK